MEKWKGKVAVVTGASSGIGMETCKQLVINGMTVVGFARREDRLMKMEEELKENSGKFYYQIVDVSSEENILKAFEWVKSTLGSVEVLINNAGVWKSVDLLGSTEDWKLMYDTNVMGLNICSREAINIMKEMNNEGHIININSIAGHNIIFGMNDISIYSSTKHAIVSITEYLRLMLCTQKLPIRVTSISPGIVETEMSTRFNLERLGHNEFMLPIDIANAIIYALSAPQRVNVAEIILRPSFEDLLALV